MMRVKFDVSVSDSEVGSLLPSMSSGVESCKIFLDGGGSVELEYKTLERMLACIDTDRKVRSDNWRKKCL